MKFHPLSELFPLIEGREFDELAADIRANGLREAIWTYEGQILDGRNRWRACEAAGVVDRPIREYAGDEPLAFVVSLNLHRRHLDESQRAMVAAKIATLPAHRPARNPANLPPSQSVAAELLNVSERTVRTARKVVETGAPELVKAVETGKVSVSAAADVAELPKDEQRELVARGEKEILARAKEIKTQKARQRADERQAEIQQRAAEARTRVGLSPGIIVGDFRAAAFELPDDSVDLIFTDPPYDRGSVPMYADLARLSAAKLVPGGSVITYLGDYALPEVMDAMRGAGLTFVWPLVIIHTGRTQMFQFGAKACINVRSKLLLWFSKGSDRFTSKMVDTAIFSEREKDTHEWQQGTAEARYLIERLTPEGGLVVDPFLGGGTTAVAAAELGRRWLGFEINPDTAAITSERLARVVGSAG